MGNQEQWLMLLRALLTIVGTIIVSRGWVSDPDWVTISGAILMVAPIIWGLFKFSKPGIVKTAAKLDEVAQVVVKATTEGLKIKDKTGSTPEATVTVVR